MAERPGPTDPFATAHTDRGQLPMPAVEGAVAVLLVLGVVLGFALGVTTPDTQRLQLDAYAQDAGRILAEEPPRHQGETRLSEVTKSADAFEREKGALDRRVDRILPDNLLYRVETPHGAIGYRKPPKVTTGVASVTTLYGEVTIRVWYV